MNKVAEFNKQMNDLSTIFDSNIKIDKSIKGLIDWFRNEYIKIPNKYPGDQFVVEQIMKHARLGFTLIISICETYIFLKYTLEVLKYNQAMGK